MQKSFLLLLVLSHTIHLQAQNSPPAVNRFLDVSGALGDKEGTISFSYVNNWTVGKSFAEYKTTYLYQVAPDGTRVDRFRNKVNAFGIGVSYDL